MTPDRMSPDRRSLLRSLLFTGGALASSRFLAACGDSSGIPAATAAAQPQELGAIAPAPATPPSGSPPPGTEPPPTSPPVTPPPGAPPAMTRPRSGLMGVDGLMPADANGLRLPPGFSSRVVAVSGEIPVLGSTYPWHGFPDGGDCFATDDGGWIYVSNSEIPIIPEPFPRKPDLGGVGVLRFDREGTLVASYSILSGTNANCCGGAMPWGTWLSCEEYDEGQVYECDPLGVAPAVVKPLLGRFSHEGAVLDPVGKAVYMTEDQGDSQFYRVLLSATDWPADAPRAALQEGTLQVLRIPGLEGKTASLKNDANLDLLKPTAVEWVNVADPDAPQTSANRHPQSARFRRAEGIFFRDGTVCFVSSTGSSVWAYDCAAQTIRLLYDEEMFPGQEADRPLLDGDNLYITPAGDVLITEDTGQLRMTAVLADGRAVPIVQLVETNPTGMNASELAGPALSPDGTRLYFSSQRTTRGQVPGPGITFEVTGPFLLPAAA